MKRKAPQIQFFLGTNSPKGFVSLYHQWANQDHALAFYVLKGGPGCGKSTLMRRVAQNVEAAGFPVEYILCAGDPDSLDGIAIPKKRAALVDGTAPHSMDPAYPGVTGHYVDLSHGYDRPGLFAQRESIIAAAQAYRACYPKAYDCFAEAERIRQHSQQIVRTHQTLEAAKACADALLDREVKKPQDRQGRRHLRFLSALTCQGRIILTETAAALCPRIYAIQDHCGLSHILLQHLETGFLDRGHDVLSCPSPEHPDQLDHLLVPSLSLAFLTNPDPCSVPFRILQTEDWIEASVWSENRSFLDASRQSAEAQNQKGLRFLTEAKEKHDHLEALYQPYMDFSQNQDRAEQIAAEILALPDPG